MGEDLVKHCVGVLTSGHGVLRAVLLSDGRNGKLVSGWKEWWKLEDNKCSVHYYQSGAELVRRQSSSGHVRALAPVVQ